jgi:hypothetical protein
MIPIANYILHDSLHTDIIFLKFLYYILYIAVVYFYFIIRLPVNKWIFVPEHLACTWQIFLFPLYQHPYAKEKTTL